MELEEKLKKVKRFELIDDNGRVYCTYGAEDIQLSFQDDGTTLKVFLRTDQDATYDDWHVVAYGKTMKEFLKPE